MSFTEATGTYMTLGTVVGQSTGYDPVGAVVRSVRYKPGWKFGILGYGGTAIGTRMLTITVETIEPLTWEQAIITHQLPIPAALGPDQREIEDWIFAQIVNVERHEAAEFYTVGEVRPFLPDHGPGADVYDIRRRSQ